MNKVYYGKKNRKTGEKEDILNHLMLTGELAASFGKSFGCENLMRLLGQLHDIGKATQLFQDVLDGNATGIDHAWTSGIFFDNYILMNNKGNGYFNIFPPKTGLLREYLSSLLASHHSSLELLPKTMLKKRENFNDSEILRSVDNRIKKLSYQNEELEYIAQYVEENNLLIPIIESDYLNVNEISKNYENIELIKQIIWTLYLRMLDSCLIDADYTASALFEDKNYLNKFGGKMLNPSKMIDELNLYRKQFTSNEGINELRNRVYADAWDAGINTSSIHCMTAPTGTAKTMAMMGFSLRQALRFQKDRIFIILPHLSIISQTTKILKSIFGDDMVLEIDSQTEYNEETKLQSERWDAPIIVTTSSAFFSTLFSSKPTKLRKLHQIANSVVCFDEFQTLPNNVLTSTLNTMYFIAECFNTKILFSSATKPSYKYRKNTIWTPREVIKDVEKLYEDYDKIRKIETEFSKKENITEEELYNYFKPHSNSCVIFNTIKAAEKYYKILEKEESVDSIFIISSRMCAKHKLDVIEKIKEKIRRGERVLVSSTQAIEVGVDIDFEYVGREYAPYDAVVQSAGRCNRNGKNIGHILIFKIEGNKFPSNAYKRSAQTTMYLAKKHNININSLKYMDLYYKEEFSINEEDDSALLDAIKDKDFIEIDNNYKLIDSEQYQVIVPYSNMMTEYDTILQTIQQNNYRITKRDIKDSASFTVNIFSKKDLVKIATPLYFGNDVFDTHWYILENKNCYDDKKGLIIDNNVVQGMFY